MPTLNMACTNKESRPDVLDGSLLCASLKLSFFIPLLVPFYPLISIGLWIKIFRF
jgi:hypothetical protein